ncbi:MAG TPA: hypothetical protein ENH08_00965, partial [Chromatiales bacterium]|nr:hypothetical protein [Chromatiales bacterium]
MNTPPERPTRGVARLSPGLRAAIILSGIAGLGLALALIVHGGLRDILRILDLAGWALLWVIPVHIVP